MYMCIYIYIYCTCICMYIYIYIYKVESITLCDRRRSFLSSGGRIRTSPGQKPVPDWKAAKTKS